MKIKNIILLAGAVAAGSLFAEPQPYSFLKNFKGGWDRRKPVEFITEADGSRILKLGGSDDYKMRGALDIKNIDKALEAMEAKGFLYLTVEELYAMKGETLEPLTVYWGPGEPTGIRN